MANDESPYHDVSLAHILAVTNDPRQFVMIGMLARPFLQKFLYLLEHRHFPPANKALNALLNIFLMDWEEATGVVTAIPQSYRPLAQAIAHECFLRFANGVPGIIGGDMSTATDVVVGGMVIKAKQFPARTDNCFQIENDWKQGNVAADPDSRDARGRAGRSRATTKHVKVH